MEFVPSAEFQRKIGHYQDKALMEPVVVTRNGRERLVLLSAIEYHRLKRSDRQVLSVGELSNEDLQAIAAAEVPAGLGTGFASYFKEIHLDGDIEELKGETVQPASFGS